jgi:hypothetical protein
MIEDLDLAGVMKLCPTPHYRGKGYKRGYACFEILDDSTSVYTTESSEFFFFLDRWLDYELVGTWEFFVLCDDTYEQNQMNWYR